MSLILVTGIPESGRDSIIDMVITGSKKNLPSFEYLKFDNILSMDVDKKAEELDLWSFSKRIRHIHKIQKEFHTSLRTNIKALRSKKNHIIVNGYFTLKTPSGYMPLLSKTDIRFFKPDVIVIVDMDFESPVLIKKLGKEKVRKLKYHQDINLNYAMGYSTLTKSVVNVVRVEYGNLKDALKEMVDIVTLSLQ